MKNNETSNRLYTAEDTASLCQSVVYGCVQGLAVFGEPELPQDFCSLSVVFVRTRLDIVSQSQIVRSSLH